MYAYSQLHSQLHSQRTELISPRGQQRIHVHVRNMRVYIRTDQSLRPAENLYLSRYVGRGA